MRLIAVLLGTWCLFVEIRSQGFKPSRDLTQHNLFRRQLSPTQQTHILNDVQQHQQQQQHRFNIQNPEQQYFQQQSVEISLNPTKQTIIDQRPPPLQQQPSNTIRFPQNNYRTINNLNSNVLQHHTQTNFIPNFVQQNPQQQVSNNQIQRSLNNQLQVPSSQQPQPANPTQQSQIPIDQEFHAQNFITLRNHFTQPTGPTAPNQQYIQQQQQFQETPQFQSPPQYQQLPQQQLPQQQLPQQQLPQQQIQQFQAPQQIQQPIQQSIQQPIQQSIQQPIQQHIQQPIQQVSFQPTQSSPNQQFVLPPQQQQVNPTQQFQTVPPQFQTSAQIPVPQTQQFQVVNQYQQYQPQNSGNVQLTAEQEAKQKLIQKHEAFVQKQYEKQQNKVKQLHDEFLQKQQTYKGPGLTIRQPIFDRANSHIKSRPIAPSETNLFDFALKKYYEEHPTTTTTTTTTTTAKGTTTGNNDEDPYEQLLRAQRKDIYSTLRLDSDKVKPKSTKTRPKSTKAFGREELLKQLKLALAENPQPSLGNKTFDAMDLVLPNGEKVQVIRTTDPNLLTGADSNRVQLTLPSPEQFNEPPHPIQNRKASARPETPDILKQIAPEHTRDLHLPNGQKVEIVRAPVPPSISGLKELPADLSSLYSQSVGDEAQIISSDGPPSIEELAQRGLIPEGYEIIQQPAPGSRPQPAPQPKPAPKKAPTFVYLEEQPDGTFKIQGVKANGEKEAQTSGAEVDSILQRIKQGEIQLPPSVTKLQLPGQDHSPHVSQIPHTQQVPQTTTTRRPHPTQRRPTTTTTTTTTTTATPRIYTYQSTYEVTATPSFYASTPRVTFPSSTVSPYSTLAPQVHRANTPNNLQAASSTRETTLAPPVTYSHYTPEFTPTEPSSTERFVSTTQRQSTPQEDLIQILKSNGLYAMAKYLRQSGLDGILNETGPYTVFAPTDKAFKNLLIQLGGPERAEEKFKANPRLLSGLLLHHVIPGAFHITSLQDEMTGVSLAGTQLRVNQYTMHDQEWNDVLITTINGAMVVTERQDIKIPQGIAHAVDRVMFPLPVGDLLQTLQSDRENRFTHFLKIVYSSGLSEILQNKGTKTYTVFAPSDTAFSAMDPEELQKLETDKDKAQEFAMRHIIPGTLFSAGMRFYQVKDSLIDGKTITLQKTSAGKIKVNESQMVTSNIPSTNGVIHALDGLL